MPRPTLDPATPLTELHVHLGAAVTPAIMWGIAHAQGIRLPTKDYWEFRDLITVGRAGGALRGLPGPLPLDRADPVEPHRGRAQRVRGHRRGLPQEQRHPPRAALQPDEAQPRRRAGPGPHHRRGGARHGPRRPRVSAGPGRAHLLPGPRLQLRAERDHRRQGDQPGGTAAWWRSTSPGRSRPGSASPTTATCSTSAPRGAGRDRPCRRDGGPEEVREAVEALEPTRIGHGIRSTRDLRVHGHAARARHRAGGLPVVEPEHRGSCRNHAELREIMRALVDHEVRFALSTDGPEMLRSYLRDEIAMLLRREILSLEEVERAIETAREASFVDRAPVPGGVVRRPMAGQRPRRRSPSKSRSRLVDCRPCPRSGGRSANVRPPAA